jgi:hypothetical protein
MVPAEVGELGEEQDLVELGRAAGPVAAEAVGDVQQELGECPLVVPRIHARDVTERV